MAIASQEGADDGVLPDVADLVPRSLLVDQHCLHRNGSGTTEVTGQLGEGMCPDLYGDAERYEVDMTVS